MPEVTKETKRFLGVKDVQKIFGIGREKAIALINTEGFPAMKIGKTYRIDSERLEAWIKGNEGRTVNIRKENDK